MLEREDVVNAREGSELDYIVLFIAHLIIQQRPYLMSNLLIPFSGSSDESSREIIASCSHVIKFVAPEETIRARPQRIGAGPK